jgi:hypothetical protein
MNTTYNETTETTDEAGNGRMKRLVRSIITYIEESEVTTAGEYGGGEEWAEIKKGVADSNLFFDRHKEGVELHAEAEWAIEKIKENANAQCPVTEGEPSCLPLSAEVGCNDLIDQKIGDLEFKEVIMNRDCRGYEDFQWAHHAEWGSITILDRMTGFGFRDVETGFRDPDGRFWLASGNFSIKAYPELTVKEAIEKIKENANTCCG